MRSGGDGRLEQRSINDRVVFFEQGKKVIESNWLLGVGAGNFIQALKIENQTNQDWTYQPVHNVLLLIWAETGIVGFLLSFVLLILALWMAWQKSEFGLGLIMVLLPTLAVDHWLWSLHLGLILCGFIVGLILNFSKYENRN